MSMATFRANRQRSIPKFSPKHLQKIVGPLISGPSGILTLQDAMHCLPRKQLSEPPQAYQDGGGLFSFPDWSYPRTDQSDPFKELRQSFFHMILQNSYHKRLLCHFHMGDPNPHFLTKNWSHFNNVWCVGCKSATWQSTGPLESINQCIWGSCNLFLHFWMMKTITFSNRLSKGFPLDSAMIFHHPTALPRNRRMTIWVANHLAFIWTIGVSSSDRPELADELVQSEVNQGWVEPFNGSIEDAQTRWPTGVAIGRLGIAISDSRDPRLVVDSSICGTNSSCSVREHQALPTSKDVLRTFPLRDNDEEVGGLSLDIKAAHKRVVIRESERGLLGFSHAGRLYFYRAAPFGAIFSAHWWGRLGGFLVRLWHLLIYIKHAPWLYVDDFLFSQNWQVLPLSSAFICIFFQLMKIPISWKKSVIAKELQWIGWRFNFSAGLVSLDPNKRKKLINLIDAISGKTYIHKRDIERFLGLAMWVNPTIFGYANHASTFLCWLVFTSCLIIQHWSGNVARTLEPLGWQTAVHINSSRHGDPRHGILVSVRHQQVFNKADLERIRLSERRIWLRIRKPNSSKRSLSKSSVRCLQLLRTWTLNLCPTRSMYPKPIWPGFSAADACATGSTCQIGGFIELEDSRLWFSERFTVADITALGLPMRLEAQKDIACYETLAQMALLHIFAFQYPHQRLRVILPTVSDNTSAEAGVNQLFITSEPLCFFLEKIGQLSSSLNVDMDTSHISGVDNVTADLLSTWDFESILPTGFNQSNRVKLTLSDLWMTKSSLRVVPPNL